MSDTKHERLNPETALLADMQRVAQTLLERREVIADMELYTSVQDLVWTLFYRLNTDDIGESKTRILQIIDSIDKQYPGIRSHLIEASIWEMLHNQNRF